MGAFSAGRAAVMDGFDADLDSKTSSSPAGRVAAGAPEQDGDAKETVTKPSKTVNGSDPRDGSLTTIADTIPTEGLAFFLAFYGLFISTMGAAQDWARPWLAFGTVAGAVVVTAAFTVAAGWNELKSKRSPQNRKAARNRLLVRTFLFSGLAVIYIGATPQNPFVLILEWSLLPGTIVAAIAAFAIVRFGQLRDLIAGKPKRA